jgi:vacuolar-type H+-ATPase subunit E/Vma4
MDRAEGEALLEEIRRHAESERKKILEEASARVEASRKSADTEVRAMETEARRSLERRVALDRNRITGDLENEARIRSLGARREALGQAFARAREEISRAAAGPRYRAALLALAREAAAILGEPGAIVFARRDEALGREVVAALGLRCAVRAEGDEPGTVVAVSPDGRRRADNSLAVRLANAELLLETDVARRLFPSQ